MEHYYLCPKCNSKTLLPRCNTCGYEIPFVNSIYRFCNDASVKLDGDKQYIGYDNIDEINEIAKLDYVKHIYAYENYRVAPSILTSGAASNQVKMKISTSKSLGYDGAGINIGILEAVEWTDETMSSYNEGVDINSYHLAGANITWKQYSPPIGTRNDFSTHAYTVTSVIAGQRKNISNQIFEGVVPNSTIFGTSCYDSNSLSTGLAYLISKNVNIINMSMGVPDENVYGLIDAQIDELATLHNVAFVISAGNSDPNTNPHARVTSPGHAYNAITVGNLDTTGSAPYPINQTSCYNQSNCAWETNKPDICASGTNIMIPYNSQYAYVSSGTSLAAPYVAGVVAQMMQANSTYKSAINKMKAVLLTAANSKPTYISSANSNTLLNDSDIIRDKTGCGILDAAVAIDMAERGSGTGVTLNLNQTQTLGQIIKITSPTGMYVQAGKTIRVVMCYNKPDYSVLSNTYGNDVYLGLYKSDTPVDLDLLSRNNVKVIEYTAAQTQTFNVRAFLLSYVPSSQTSYLRINIGYRILD